MPPASNKALRASVKPLLWIPLLAKPTIASPGFTSRPTTGRHADEVDGLRRPLVLDDGAHLRDLAGDDVHARRPRALVEPLADRFQHRRGGRLDGDVVEERHGLGADADGVVDVHGHAVDADRVVALEHLRDQHLGAHAVRAQGQTESMPDVDHARVEADLHGLAAELAGAAKLARAIHPPEERAQAELGIVEHAGIAVAGALDAHLSTSGVGFKGAGRVTAGRRKRRRPHSAGPGSCPAAARPRHRH
jgi:hypothetical protein